MGRTATVADSQKTRAAANRARALKKRKLAQEAKESRKPNWVIKEAPELRAIEVEGKADEAKSATQEEMDPAEAEAAYMQLKAFELRASERRKAEEDKKASEEAIRFELWAKANRRSTDGELAENKGLPQATDDDSSESTSVGIVPCCAAMFPPECDPMLPGSDSISNLSICQSYI